MITGPNIINDGLIFGYDADDRSTRFYKGEPTTNIVPSPQNNSRFTISNSWGTFNANKYGWPSINGQYFSIGTVSTISDNIVTMNSSHPLLSFDVVTPQTTGGGVTAGTNYVVKKISSTQFSLHTHSSSQNGSLGYINPQTNFYKVHDAYANDTRISVNSTNFPTMWIGPAHLPNSGLIKEIVTDGGYVQNTNCMRLHIYRGDGVVDGMAYNVNCSVASGNTITMSVWLKSATLTAVGKTLRYETYFGSGYAGTNVNFILGEYNKWIRYSYTWIASNTYSFISYWFPQGSTDKYDIDMADFQVEIKSHATQYTLSSRSATESLIDLKRTSTIDLSNMTFDTTAHPYIMSGTTNHIDISSDLFNLARTNFTISIWCYYYGYISQGSSWNCLIAYDHLQQQVMVFQQCLIIKQFLLQDIMQLVLILISKMVGII
jgi:hypothetical protein